MVREIGKQYSKDDIDDISGFKRKARLHQSKFRAEILQVDFEEYGNRLTEPDAIKGVNFYNGIPIFEEVENQFKYSEALYANMLRSQHIPFNFFIPLRMELNYARDVLNVFFDNKISVIDKILIEYAPSPRKEFLNDRTSFDVFIEFIHENKHKGIIGLEVKYTETEYPLKPGSKEENYVLDKNSPYNLLTRKTQIFNTLSYEKLHEDRYRQVWRNQLLAESMIKKNKSDSDIEHCYTGVLFPRGNEHYMQVVREYAEFLNSESTNKFTGITYEEFIDVALNQTSDRKLLDWLEYLSRRYIVE